MGKHYNIMTSSDDNLAPYVAVQLTAMAYNLSDADIDFFFLHSRVSPQNIEMLKALCNELGNGMIHFHEIIVPHAEVYSELAKFGGHWPGEAYYCLCPHLLLPDNINKVLYLDAGDTLVIGDIEPYYQCDFFGKSLVVTASRYKTEAESIKPYNKEDLHNHEQMLPEILQGIFNSGSFTINLDKMRKDGITLADYRYLAESLREILGKDYNIYRGDQGLLSAAFVDDVRYYGFPHIRSVWYRPFNFCLWYYNGMNEVPDYDPAILHFVGTAFKPWNGYYPVPVKRFQKQEQLHSINELNSCQRGYFYIWHEYAILADMILTRLGY